MMTLLGLLLLAAQLLPVLILARLFLWFRKRSGAKDYWPKAWTVALLLGVARAIVVYAGWLVGGNPNAPKALRFLGLLCATYVLPEGLLLSRIEPAKASPETGHLIFALVTFAGGALWTSLVAAVARTGARTTASEPDGKLSWEKEDTP